MSLNLLISTSIVDQTETQDKVKISSNGLFTDGHFSGGGSLAVNASKTIYSGLSNFVFIKSSKTLEITLNGTTIITIHPLQQDYLFVDGVFALSGDFSSISIKNTSLEESTYSFLITE